jgi:hypothetical protein
LATATVAMDDSIPQVHARAAGPVLSRWIGNVRKVGCLDQAYNNEARMKWVQSVVQNSATQRDGYRGDPRTVRLESGKVMVVVHHTSGSVIEVVGL